MIFSRFFIVGVGKGYSHCLTVSALPPPGSSFEVEVDDLHLVFCTYRAYDIKVKWVLMKAADFMKPSFVSIPDIVTGLFIYEV